MALFILPLQHKKTVPEEKTSVSSTDTPWIEHQEVALFINPKNTPSSKTLAKNCSDVVIADKLDVLFKDEDCALVTTKEELISFLNKSDVFGLDTETTGLLWYKDKLVGFSLGTATQSIYVPLNHKKGENYTGDKEELVSLLLSKKYYGFNAKFDTLFMSQLSEELLNLDFIGEGYLAIRCTNNLYPDSLKGAYQKFIDPSSEFYDFGSLFSKPFDAYDPIHVYKYAAVDARKHYVITTFFENALKKTPKVFKIYSKIEVPLIKVITRMEKRGICMDAEYIKNLKALLEADAKPILEEIQTITWKGLNPGSHVQLKKAFKDVFNLSLASTDEASLLRLQGNRLADLVLELRGIQKSISTFTENLLAYAVEEGQLTIAHPGFNQYGADTGRFSSSKFNIQQIPKDNKFRKMFIARPGHTLVSVDYSQQEVRVLAALSKDPIMLEAFKKGKDFYSDMGSNIYNLPYDECTKSGKHKHIRQEMKGVVLGMNYDMQADSLGKTIGKSKEEAQLILDSLRAKYCVMYQFKDECLKFAKEHGYNETVLGRRRYYEGLGYRALHLPRFQVSGAGDQEKEILSILPSLPKQELKAFIAEAKNNKPNKITILDREAVQWVEQRQTTNSTVQGSSADMTKLAMLAYYKDPRSVEYHAPIILQIHDEIIIEAPDEYAERAGKLLAEIMNGVGAEMLDDLPMGGEPGYMKVWQKD